MDKRIAELTLPAHCTFLVGLPSTREGFNASFALSGRGYAAGFLGGWRQYENLFLTNLRMLSRLAERLGIDFVEDADCASLRTAFQNSERPIVILMSHTSRNDFEMNGRLVNQRQVLESVPLDFAGVFDICACEPDELAKELVAARRDCLIRFLPRKVDPTVWFLYFLSLFRILHTARHSYLSASEAVTISLINIGRKTMKSTKPVADALYSFLEENKQHAAPDQADHELVIDEARTDRLLNRFDHIRKSNNLSKTLAIGTLVATFVVTLYFAFLYQHDLTSVSFILGGNLLSLVVIAGWLRRIWLEGTTLDILSLLVQDLPAREAIQVIATFYHGTLDRKVG